MKRFAAALLIAASLTLSACASQPAAPSAPSAASEATPELQVQDTPAGLVGFFEGIQGDPQEIEGALAALPGDEGIATFSLMDPEALPVVSDERLEALEDALDAIGVPAAFLLVDADSGQGIQYQAGRSFYAASSTKAWFAFFLCQQADEGLISLDAPAYGQTVFPLALMGEWENPNCVGAYIENAVLYSDNGAYEALREAYDWQGYDQWVSDLALSTAVSEERFWYPDFSPCTSVQLWMNLYSYLKSDAPNALWLKTLLESTTVSNLRLGLEDGGYQGSVLNKAGFDASSTCDSGVIRVAGHTYFAAVFTQLDMGDYNAQLVNDLSAALIEAALDLK